MGDDIKGGSESLGFFNLKKMFFLFFIILIVSILVFGSYFLFFYSKACPDMACFIKAMEKCNKVYVTKQDVNSDWKYRIIGSGFEESCRVRITLLKIKQGSIDGEKLQGKEMVCDLLKGDSQYPEKDLSRCTGQLKEEMQDLIIQRMHKYLLQNIGEVKQGFNEI